MADYVKNLHFPPPDFTHNPAVLTRAAMEMVHSKADATFWRLAMLTLHVHHGAQMWVSKEVSDDLLASDVDAPAFGELSWPHPRLEVVFEDKTLPSMLAARVSRVDTAKAFNKLVGNEKLLGVLSREDRSTVLDTSEVFSTFLMETQDDAVCSVDLPDDLIDDYERTGEFIPEGGPGNPMDTGNMDEDEQTNMVEMVRLFHKLLLFCGSDGCEPRVTQEKPTRKQGGKAGFNNRPKTDRFIVEYLPHHRQERAKQASEASDKKRKFLGRRGHWREFRSARYVNVRGTRKFIYPVPGPDGKPPRRKFVVRK